MAKDVAGDSFAGYSILQKILRNSRIDFSEQLRSQYAEASGIKPQDVTSEDLENMMNYIYAKIASPEAVDMLKNIPEYQKILSKGGGFLDKTASVLK
jgi:hypothetical protein